MRVFGKSLGGQAKGRDEQEFRLFPVTKSVGELHPQSRIPRKPLRRVLGGVCGGFVGDSSVIWDGEV